MSPARWYLGAGSCATWTTYGWVLGQPAVWLSAGFGLVCAVATCVALHRGRTVPPVLSVTGRRPAVATRPALAAAA